MMHILPLGNYILYN